MPDSYTDITHQSWGNRFQDSLVGALVGLLMFFGAFPLLFFNEGRAVDRARALDEGNQIVISVDTHQVTSTYEGQLVHLIGETDTDDTLKDAMFGVAVDKVIKLQRTVEMFQWQEEEHSETEQLWGGSTRTVTTYTYTKTWSDRLIESNRFKRSEGHENPASMPVTKETFIAKHVNMGDFTLSSSIVSRLNNYQHLPMTAETLGQVQEGVLVQLFRGSMTEGTYSSKSEKKLHLNFGDFFLGQNPAHPQVGDLQIKFKVVRPTTISVVAKQVGSNLVPYPTKEGDSSIELFEYGAVTAKDMFKYAHMSNTRFTWFLRFIGFLVMFFGLSMIFHVLKVAVAFVPFLAEIVEWLGLFLALIMATTLSLLTIAFAWLYYRPLLGITVFLLALGVLYLLKFVRKQPLSGQKYSQKSVESQLPSIEMQPVLVEPRPLSVQPQPLPVQPRPLPVQPQPVSVQPQPLPVQPQPVSVQPLPVQPQPVSVQPQPVSVQPQPLSIEPRPLSIEPRPAPVQPQPLSIEELPQPSLELPNEPALIHETVIPNKSA